MRGRRETTVNRAEDAMPNLFAGAASLLLGEDSEETDNRDAWQLLEALGYAAATEFKRAESGSETRHRAALLKVASRFARVFELTAPDAPGLICFGAEFDPVLADPLQAGSPVVGVSGVGVSLQEAFQGCIGEGIEYLSQLQTGNDALERARRGDPAAELGPQGRTFLAAFSAHRLRPDVELSWHRATRLIDGRAAVWEATDRFSVSKDAKVFELWEYSVADRLGLIAAASYALALGISDIAAAVSARAALARDLLSTVPGVSVQDLGRERCGIVSFSVAGRDAEEVRDELWERGVAVSVTYDTSTQFDMTRRGFGALVRASPHYFVSPEQIADFVRKIQAI